MPRHHLVSVLLVCLTVFVLPSALPAQSEGISTANPTGPLPARSSGIGKSLVRKAQQIYIAADEILTAAETAIATGQIQSIDPAKIGQAAVAQLYLSHYSARLSFLGEPAAHDYRMRSQDIIARVHNIVTTYKESPFGVGKFNDATVLAKLDAKYKRQLARVHMFAKKQNWDVALREMLAILTDINPYRMWYQSALQSGMFRDYNETYGKLVEYVHAYWKNDALQRLTAEMQRTKPTFALVLQDIQDATAKLSAGEKLTPLKNIPMLEAEPDEDDNDVDLLSSDSSSKTSPSAKPAAKPATDKASPPAIAADTSETQPDETVAGPEWLRGFLLKWQASQIRTLRVLALNLAGGAVANQNSNAGATALVNEQRTFTENVLGSIATFITTDAQNVSAEEARTRYQHYMYVIGRLSGLVDEGMLLNHLEPALAQLAEKSPELAQDVATYREFSADVLRWKERIAEFKQQVSADAPADRAVAAAARIDGPDSKTLYSNPSTTWPEANVSLCLLIKQMSEQLVAKNIVAENFVGSRVNPTHSNSASKSGVYVHMESPFDSAAAIQEFASCLLITESAGPLTLQCELALDSMELGNLAAAGGTVQSAEIVGRLPALYDFTPEDWGPITLGPLDDDVVDTTITKQVLVRLHVSPDWIRYRYAFLSL